MGLRDRISDVRTMKRLFEAAERRAATDGRAEPAAEDLLLAACAADEGSGRAALAAVGVDEEALAAAVRRVHAAVLPAGLDPDGVPDGRLPAATAGTGAFRSTGSFQELFGEVQRRVRRSGGRLDGAWFVLVAAEREHGTVARALDDLGVDRAALRAAALDALGTRRT